MAKRMKAPEGVYLIKKYANRKLYCVNESEYMTLDDIELLVRDNYEIKVIENETNTDITAEIMLALITEREKRRLNADPATRHNMRLQYESILTKATKLGDLLANR